MCRAGDIETNPGPGPGAARFPCGGCGGGVGWGRSFSIACGTCKVWWHERCCGMDRTQIRRAEKDGWNCPKCGKEGNKPATEPRSSGQLNQRQAKYARVTLGKECCACGAGVRQGAGFLTCQCGNICHKQATCSGRKRSIQNDEGWKCKKCDPGTSIRTVMGRAITGLKAALEESSKKERTARTMCVQCGQPTRASRSKLTCNACGREGHKDAKCSKAGRAEIEALIAGNAWTCNGCLAKRAQMTPEDVKEDCEGKEQGRAKTARKKIRIIQWNADDIRAKIPELQCRLREEEIDICMVQETKRREQMRTPRIEGFTAVRKDRGGEKKGGGLITYIKEDLQFEDLETKIDANRTTIEALGVRVRLKELGAVNLFNVYCPPFRRAGVENANAEDQFRTEDLPKCKNAVYAGDLNAHSDIWDPYMTPDERGEKLENWMMDNNMLCLNDGNATRVNPGTGGLSCPDTTIIPEPWAGRMEWFVGEDLGSDHLPVYVTLEADAKLMDEAPPRTTWSWKKAKWEEYATKVDELIEKIPIDASISVRANSLAESMVKAAQQHIGQVTLRSRVVNWMTPEIKEAIKERNEPRKNLTNDKQRWVEQCRKIKEMVQEEKTRRWREYLEEAEESQDAAKTWRVIKSLSGCPQSNGRNEVRKHEGKTYGSGKKKATIFMQHYAKVSRLKFSREERAVNREMKRKLRIRGKEEQDQEETRDFSVTELETAIHQMKEKSAAGEDAVSPRFIKHLSDKARKFLLKILNDSWRSGFSPQAWRGAVIIPLQKAGKPASKLDSYRPVSLTSCVAKTMERMVANRLQYMAEKHGWWCEEQAGFRSGQCTEDQTIRISQDISDGFQCKPMERSVLALLDYSKAYDKLWREQLLIGMLKKGVPARFVSWIKGFLRNRMARVKVDNQLGKKFSLKEGLPQGAVMSPLLFLFFIDNVKEEIVKERVKVNLSMYADDVAIWSRSVHKLEAQAQVQKAVEIINKWSKKNKLTLNAGKSEAAFFSTDVNEARWEPKIAMDGEFFRFNANPVFLGITFDRTLSLGAQATKAAAKAKRRSNILAACAGQSWGWHKDSLVMTYKSNIRSGLDYGAAGWQPWISATNMELMERAQNNALRRVTGQMKTTPVEALRLEAEISSYKTHSERMIVKSYEKAIRLPEDNPRARATQSVVRHRSKLRSSWREKAKTLREKCEEECRGFLKTTGQKIKCLGRPPWKWETDKHWVAEKSLRGGSTKASTEEAMKADAIETIKSQCMETTIYTDGSASEGWKNGGSAAVVTKGPPEEPEVLAVLKQRGRSWTSSFETEVKALGLAVKHLKDSGCKEALICSDSQATISALKSKNKKACTDIRRLREALADIEGLNGNLRINWVPGHCGLAGNELADEAANEAARSGERAQSGDEISMAAATCIIKKAIRDKKTVHPILGETYANKPSAKPESRAQAVMLAQLRSGHHMGLRACSAIVKNGDPTCLRCGEDVETLKHWLQECPASATERRRMFGTDKRPLALLNSDGAKVCEFMRRTMLTGNEGERSPAQEREMGRSGTGLRPVDQ